VLKVKQASATLPTGLTDEQVIADGIALVSPQFKPCWRKRRSITTLPK